MATRRESGSLRSPDTVDRILVIGTAVIWLAVIGVGVAATVALVDLGTGRQPESGSGSQTPWLLYVVIAVSAVIIVGAIPLLLRARRNAVAEPPRAPVKPVPGEANYATAGPARPAREAPTEKLRVFGTAADPTGRGTSVNRPPQSSRIALSPESIERMWLRVTASIAAAMGTAMLAVAAATYLMAVDEISAAWAALIVAAVVTVAMPVIPWLFLRQLRARIAATGRSS
ncbi:DUF2561 family protein [Mycobacterium sp.]|uniref:DUF2561 family protein n=1 Tax=Mycobacterium sp. TaxID=1785 RepID=UPI002B8AAA0E|nr:DUF2561 family protein [Mycobacterium sp.]HME50242.1 DUF2561 family protein [Mycobacterium sp.]